ASELALRTGSIGVGQFQPRRRVSPRLKGLERLTRAALQTLRVVAHVGQEMLHRAQQEGTESPPLWLNAGNPLAGEQPREEFLCQLPRRLLVRRVGADKGKNRRVVSGAQIAQCRPGLGRITPSLQHPRPLRRDERGVW